jgi:KDO2-lipid IV(A) lauroyltransferase
MRESLLDSWLFYRSAELLARFLPRRVVLFFADALAEGAFFTFFRKNRLILMRNYSMIFSHFSNSQLKWLTYKNFRNFSKFIYEFIKIPAMNLEKIRENFVFEGLERVEEVLKRGKGAIIITAHLGNWELGGIAFTLKGFPMTVVVWPHKSRKVSEFFDRRRSSKGMKVVQVGEAREGTLRALRRNECVAILGDRNYTGRGISVSFFGRQVRFPVGAFQLSARTGAPIIPIFTVRRRDGKYRFIVESPISLEESNKRVVDTDNSKVGIREVLKENLQSWSAILEKYIERYPEQWFLFEPVFE